MVLWEVLGTLPSLADLTLLALKAIDTASHSAHVPEKSHRQSEGPKYFDALEKLNVTGPFFLIQHLLGFIDSRCLKRLEVFADENRVRNNHEADDLFTPSMTIATSKWSQSLKELLVMDPSSSGTGYIHAIPKCLTYFHEMESFCLWGWKIKNVDDDVRRLVMSWPKLETLAVVPGPFDSDHRDTFISLSTLRIIAESCPELRYLIITLDTSTISPFDTHSSNTQASKEFQIQMAQHLDFIFPYLKSIAVEDNDLTWLGLGIRDLVKLCQNVRRRQSSQ